jgi:hypothetical protein
MLADLVFIEGKGKQAKVEIILFENATSPISQLASDSNLEANQCVFYWLYII